MSDAQVQAPEGGRRPRWLAILAVALVVIGLIVLIGLFVRSISARLVSARTIDQATAIAKQADTNVVAVDKAVRSPVDEVSAETKTLALKRIAPTRAKLEQVTSLVDAAYEALNDDEREQAALLRATAEARLGMLALAEPILKTDAAASASATRLSAGWEQLLAAKTVSREAAGQYNKLTKPAVTQSNRLLAQAETKLSSANDEFLAAQQAFPDLDVAPYLTYVTTLKQLNSLAQLSNSEWLKGRAAQANVYTNRYNILEKQALEQAKALPASPNKAIAEAYDAATARSLQEYVAARKKATEADKQLREH